MSKKIKNSHVGRRSTWSFVRLALLWARKGGIFRGRLLSSHLRSLHMPKFIKSIGTRGDRIKYIKERQLTFDKSPVIHVKMHHPNSMRFLIPNIPCINPPADFDHDFAGEDEDGPYSARKSFLYEEINGEDEDEDEGLDLRAEEFITQFYERMKLQRQISYLEYTDHASTDTSSISSDPC